MQSKKILRRFKKEVNSCSTTTWSAETKKPRTTPCYNAYEMRKDNETLILQKY